MEKIEEKTDFLLSSLNFPCQFISTSNDVITDKFFSKQNDNMCHRSFGTVNAKMDEIMDIIWNIYNSETNIKTYDESICYYQLIDQINDDMRLCYQVNELPWPFWKRDLVYLQKRSLEEKLSYIVMYSVDTDITPLLDNHVRAIVHISGYVVIPVSGGSHVYRIASIDPGGYIPNFITDYYVHNNAKMIDMIKEKICNQ